jgi:hypothetical protein
MSTAYARTVQAPTGTMQARDLATGDVVLIRRPGALERTPEKILNAARVYGDIALAFEWGTKLCSPKIPVALA